MNLKYKNKQELIDDLKRILKLMEEEHIVEDDYDAKKEGYIDIDDYNYIINLNERVENFIQKAKSTRRLNGEELSETDIQGIKETWIQVQLLHR